MRFERTSEATSTCEGRTNSADDETNARVDADSENSDGRANTAFCKKTIHQWTTVLCIIIEYVSNFKHRYFTFSLLFISNQLNKSNAFDYTEAIRI